MRRAPARVGRTAFDKTLHRGLGGPHLPQVALVVLAGEEHFVLIKRGVARGNFSLRTAQGQEVGRVPQQALLFAVLLLLQ